MTVLVACDLDGTLVYSRRALGRAADDVSGEPADLVCVEEIDGEPASFMTREAADEMQRLAACATVVPVTVRSPDQLARVRLPGASRYAVAANGGRLFVDGRVDHDWSRHVADLVSAQAPFADVEAHLADVAQQGWLHRARGVEGLFCYGIVDPATLPRHVEAEERLFAERLGWRMSLQGRKLYWVPRSLDKAIAVAELAERTGARVVLAAGDSGLDEQMLSAADAAIRPAHGELHRAGMTAPRLTVTSSRGVRAGAEIARWLRAQASARGASGAALLATPAH